MNKLSILVGDNPFHGISHLSQERARARSFQDDQKFIQEAANLVDLSLENSATGFMFSVDEVTLGILRNIAERKRTQKVALYAIVPYAYEYVRKATQMGGVGGLVRNLAKEMIFSSNIKVVVSNAGGVLRFNPSSLLKTYVAYELSRIKSAMGDNAELKTVMLHEIITDMALALGMEDLFKSYIKFMEKRQIKPGFETQNFAYLVEKFEEWGIDFSKLTLTTSFNKVGFQMNPSKVDCEKALVRAKQAEVIAMSILAAGYLKPIEAIEYLVNLEGLSGIVVGVSKRTQAVETFGLLNSNLIRNRI
jgi:hypothetical protein